MVVSRSATRGCPSAIYEGTVSFTPSLGPTSFTVSEPLPGQPLGDPHLIPTYPTQKTQQLTWKIREKSWIPYLDKQ